MQWLLCNVQVSVVRCSRIFIWSGTHRPSSCLDFYPEGVLADKILSAHVQYWGMVTSGVVRIFGVPLSLIWVSCSYYGSRSSWVLRQQSAKIRRDKSKPEGALSSARLWQNCKYEHFGCERQKEWLSKRMGSDTAPKLWDLFRRSSSSTQARAESASSCQGHRRDRDHRQLLPHTSSSVGPLSRTHN